MALNVRLPCARFLVYHRSCFRFLSLSKAPRGLGCSTPALLRQRSHVSCLAPGACGVSRCPPGMYLLCLLGSITSHLTPPPPGPLLSPLVCRHLSPSAACLLQSRVPLKSVLNLRRYNLERTLELLEKVRYLTASLPRLWVRGDWGAPIIGRGPLPENDEHLIMKVNARLRRDKLWQRHELQ